MFAEDLLRDVRREGFTPSSVSTYARRVGARVVRSLPEQARLVRSVAATAFILFAIQFGAALLLTWAFGRRVGVPYLVSSSGVLLLGSLWLITHIGLLHGTAGVRSMRRIPFPVILTLLRLVSVPAIVLLIHEERWTVVVWLFAASAFTDVLDGVAARALHQESQIGSVLDPAVDVVFNASIFFAMCVVGALPWWVAALMLARYALLVLGTCYLYLFHGPVKIMPTGFGKLTGVLTSVLLGLVLLGLGHWSAATQHRLKEVFDVGLGLLAFATIIQVVFIGLANKKSLEHVAEVEELLGAGSAAAGSETSVTSAPAGVPGILTRTSRGKVVGDVRWPRR